MDKIYINNLSGKCLAATPVVEGAFAKALVYVCSHGTDGAMGFIVNQPYEGITFSELSLGLPFGHTLNGSPSIYRGGPLETDKGFILHDDTYKDNTCFDINSGIRVSSSPAIIHDIVEGSGPERFMIVLGYAAWEPQQLEAEISQNLWMITPSSPELIFNARSEDKWTIALSSLGINDTNLSLPLGHS